MHRAALRIIILILTVTGSNSFAQILASRVDEARFLQTTPEGLQYDQLLGPHIGDAMATCIPPGSTDPKNLGAFVYVSLVGQKGVQHSFAVEPDTVISTCFKSKFSGRVLPRPPKHQNKTDTFGYPIAIEMKVAP